MDMEQANTFADDWIKSWNSHDIDAILSHYTEDFEMSSPVIVDSMNEPSGQLKGKAAVREYWLKALTKYPNLLFTKRHVMLGVNSITIIYDGVRGLSAEVFHFDASGHVYAAFAHYGNE